MPTLDTILLFLLADLALKASPGPDMMLVLTRGATQGWRAGVAGALGVGAAGLGQVPLVVLGLGALLHRFPLAFSVVKVLGALYLVYAGAMAVRRSLQASAPAGGGDRAETRDAFVQGIVTNLTNPKVLLFMLAFLPQFVDPAVGPEWRQLLFFGVLMKLNGALFLTACALAAAQVRGWIGTRTAVLRWQNRILGSAMIAIGLLILVR